ncbi:hypothetical protein BDV12DRAFT_205329 [Aspergillus spectabilis]
MENAAQAISTRPTVFDQQIFEQTLLRLLAASQLPFRFIKHPEFQDLVFYL